MSEDLKRLQEFDILRAISIIMLMFHHSEVYGLSLVGFPLDVLGPYFEAILLGIFFFSSGYLAELSLQKRENGVISFFGSRVLRIFPPYLFALTLYIFILGISFKKRDLLIYILGMQFIFTPNYVKPVVTIWYIGAIVLFYFIFGLLSTNLRSTRGLIVGSVFVFAVAYMLHQWVGLIDERFFKYFIVFLAGILFVRISYFAKWLAMEQIWLKIALTLFSAYIFSYVLTLSLLSPFYILSVVFFIVSCVVALFALAAKIKFGNMLKLAGILSYASFFAYLLHRPIWQWLVDIFSIATWREQVFFKLFTGSIFVFILSYWLQYGYDRLLAVFRRNE